MAFDICPSIYGLLREVTYCNDVGERVIKDTIFGKLIQPFQHIGACSSRRLNVSTFTETVSVKENNMCLSIIQYSI